MVTILESTLTNIANAIRAKTGASKTYKPSEMPDAISAISGGGITPTGTIEITQNGSVDVTNYATADVDVPIPAPPSGTINIVQNGTVDVSDYASANVAVPTGITPTGSQTFTENGTYDVTNIAEAVVNVETGGGDEDYGLADTSFDIADRYTGEVVNNRIINYSTSSVNYRAFFMLKRPVTIHDGDNVRISFNNKTGTTGYSQCYLFMNPIGSAELNGNFNSFTNTGVNKTYNYGDQDIRAIQLGPRHTTNWTDFCADIHMYINDVLIF